MAKEKKNWIQENFHFTSLLKPMIYAILFGIVYNLAYLWLINTGVQSGLQQFVEILLLCLYGLSWYFVATLAWGRQRGTLSGTKCSLVLLWLLAWNVLTFYVIQPLYQTAVTHNANAFLMILIQLAGAFVLICMIPATLLYFKGIYEGNTDLKTLLCSIRASMKEHASPIFNSWLILFLIMVAWDTLFSGPLTVYFGFNACRLSVMLLSMGNPMAFWMSLTWLAAGGASSGYAYAIVLTALFGLIENFLAINLIVYIGKFWIRRQPEYKDRSKMA